VSLKVGKPLYSEFDKLLLPNVEIRIRDLNARARELTANELALILQVRCGSPFGSPASKKVSTDPANPGQTTHRGAHPFIPRSYASIRSKVRGYSANFSREDIAGSRNLDRCAPQP
jgi:hypothetical protein